LPLASLKRLSMAFAVLLFNQLYLKQSVKHRLVVNLSHIAGCVNKKSRKSMVKLCFVIFTIFRSYPTFFECN
jgi:hypothetical protein